MKLISLMTLLPALALADADPKFVKLRDQAEPLGTVNAFVEKFVGDCASRMMGGGECEKNAEVFRQGATGKKYYMIVTEGTSSVLSMGEVKMQGAFVLNLTPFFPAANMALTHGAPSKTDGDGNPVMPFIRIDSMLPEAWTVPMMARQVQAQGLRVQIVFTPQGVWTLPKKGGGSLKGVRAKFDAVLVTVGRTGETIGAWYAK
jgi:hypothetical protein